MFTILQELINKNIAMNQIYQRQKVFSITYLETARKVPSLDKTFRINPSKQFSQACDDKLLKIQKERIELNESSQMEDYNDVLRFAKFIGLTPMSSVKRTNQTRESKFLKVHNYGKENGLRHQKQIIKNSIQNRSINFFDLKEICRKRCDKLKQQICKRYEEKRQVKIKENYFQKQKRTCSTRNINSASNHFTIQKFSDQIQLDSDLKRLRIVTGRQIEKRKRQKTKHDQTVQKFVERVYNEKVIRSKILNKISKGETQQRFLQSDEFHTRWKLTDTQFNQRGASTPSKVSRHLIRSQITKENSTKGSPSVVMSPLYLDEQIFGNFSMNPENQAHIKGLNSAYRRHRKTKSSVGLQIDNFRQKPMTPRECTSTNKHEKSRIILNFQKRAKQNTNKQNQEEHQKQEHILNHNEIQSMQQNKKDEHYKKIYLKGNKKARLKHNRNTNRFEFAQK